MTLEQIAIALIAGIPLGMFAMAFVARATRCEGCCQNADPPGDEGL